VRPRLDGNGMKREEIGYAVRRFTDGDEHPVFWGYFPAYDWVAFNWLFGSMDELPFHYPQLCLDIKQWAIELGDPELPPQSGPRHHALFDARWTRDAWVFLARLDPAAGERRATGRKNLGLGFVPEDLAHTHVARGRLKRVLEDWCPPWSGYHLYYPSRRQSSPAFALVVNALRHRD
jgi:LysR substrate binding domain